jgi:uncharacterized protein YvpB
VITLQIPSSVPIVPFHSQLTEISSPIWRLQGCGITSLAMIIDYYNDSKTSVNKLLGQGIAAGAFIENVGWSYAGLINVSKNYGLNGTTHDLSGSSMATAFSAIKKELAKGPVIASVHYKFIPNGAAHLVVIDGFDSSTNTIYYNDPDNKSGDQAISAAKFEAGWKKRYIAIRPVEVAVKGASSVSG